MKKRLIALILVSAGFASAQTNAFLSWEQCLEKTKAYNPDLVSARAAVRELEFGVSSASSGFLPQISARAGIDYGEAETDSGVKENKSASGRLTLSQDLFSGGGNIAGRRRALAQLEIGNQQYRKTLSDVELRTRLAYIDVLYAQDLVELTKKIEERRHNNVRLIQLRFDGGRENAGSLARSKAQLSQAGYEVREAERSLTYALRNLAAAMGIMEPAPGAEGDLRADAPEALADLEPLMKQTPNYSIATTQIEAAKQGMKVTRSGRFPSVSFDASAGLSSGTYDVYKGSWNVGLSASMPLYTGNRLNSQVAAAKENIIQSEMDLMDTANTLMATLQQRWNGYADAIESEAVQQELFDAEQLRAEISTAKYKQGLLSYEDWDLIESNLISQGKTHLQRRRSSEIQQAQWKNALGWSEWYTEQGE
ncbi:Outer membrane protein TolC [Pontiella desulfatans]|uniref:Outer membrane protein TolC n=1 Tax=Pontiella desulfatans TaxID=2750659 RepID=A0A6C2U6X6_PONDE|nr:TolC family protein [Pontiella desulfatans]VGO15828.1 Outer membrane protein TolC [Pontiella desulfatans]